MPLPVILALLFILILWIATAKSDRLARFWKYPTKKKPNKYPTIEDIRKKYPKKLSKEQLRNQLRAKEESEEKRKQEIIDRNIREARSAKDALRDRQFDHELKVARMLKAKITNQKFEQVNQLGEVFQSVIKREISTKLFNKLVKMANGREDVAKRLIEGNLKAFPDQSPDWCCDKAISDLERDRR